MMMMMMRGRGHIVEVQQPHVGLCVYLELGDGLADHPVQLVRRHPDEGEVYEVAVGVLGAHGADGVGALLLVVELAGAAVQQHGVQQGQQRLVHLPSLHRQLQYLRAAIHPPIHTHTLYGHRLLGCCFIFVYYYYYYYYYCIITVLLLLLLLYYYYYYYIIIIIIIIITTTVLLLQLLLLLFYYYYYYNYYCIIITSVLLLLLYCYYYYYCIIIHIITTVLLL